MDRRYANRYKIKRVQTFGRERSTSMYLRCDKEAAIRDLWRKGYAEGKHS
jgi:hypothetical protein